MSCCSYVMHMQDCGTKLYRLDRIDGLLHACGTTWATTLLTLEWRGAVRHAPPAVRQLPPRMSGHCREQHDNPLVLSTADMLLPTVPFISRQ